MKIRVLALLAAGFGMTYPPKAVAAEYVPDRPAAVLWAAEQGIVTDSAAFQLGTPCTFADARNYLASVSGQAMEDVVCPETILTRGQAIALLWEAAGKPVAGAAPRFTDTPDTADGKSALAWAEVYGITVGTGKDCFSPNIVCTKEQFLTFLYRDLPSVSDRFELPVNGATGIASVMLPVWSEDPSPVQRRRLATLNAGEAFTVLQESGDWWQIQAEEVSGWVEHRFCMVNLPDVVPSILYDNTNSYGSLFVSSGREIPGVTGKALYSADAYNPRFSSQKYMMPILYAAAKKVCAAQQNALANGDCLLVYETYRPLKTQVMVAEQLRSLAEEDEEVRYGVDTYPWSMDYFINSKISNHQWGAALDASMVQIEASEIRLSGDFRYRTITEYQPYRMPTAIHELSLHAVTTAAPGRETLGGSMNLYAIRLREYFTSAGMTPLESEWWHFNAYDALPQGSWCQAGFETDVCRSVPPVLP